MKIRKTLSIQKATSVFLQQMLIKKLKYCFTLTFFLLQNITGVSFGMIAVLTRVPFIANE